MKASFLPIFLRILAYPTVVQMKVSSSWKLSSLISSGTWISGFYLSATNKYFLVKLVG